MIRRLLPWVGVAVVGLTALAAPYLAAYAAQPEGFTFSGFLLNPIDGFSYLAKLRQGFDGSWLFQLPYAAEPGSGSFLFVFFLALGHLQRLIDATPDAVYHGARLIGAGLMFWAAYLFHETFLPSPSARRWAFGLTLLGSGLGWLGMAFGRLAIDLWVPEAFPLASGFVNAHFALSAGAMLMAFVALGRLAWSRPARIGVAAGAGLVLGAIQPFGVVVVGVVAAAWLAWIRVKPPAGSSGSTGGGRAWPLVGFLAAGTPWVTYDLWVTASHPALAAWSAQNVTPTPPVLDVLLGLGVAFFLAVFAAWRSRADLSSSLRLLVVWTGIGLALSFFPFSLQRRMLLGIYFPIAGLAGFALSEIAAGAGRRRPALAALLFALCLPTTFLLIVGTTGRALRQEGDVVLSLDERGAYEGIASIVPAGSLVLTGEVSGNRLPAYADVRVLYGHPFETPDAKEALAVVNGILGSTAAAGEVVAALQDGSVDYVLIGDREREVGPLLWLSGLRLVDERGAYSIYQVPAP